MPMIQAGNLPYSGTPTVEPNVAAPSRFDPTQANPASFGAATGQALERLGAGFEHTGNVLAENAVRQQELINQTEADNKTNQYQDAETKILYGDPNTPGDTGFFGKKGQDAIAALPTTRDQLLQLRAEMRNSLANPRQQLTFDQETRRLQSFTLSRMGAHYDQEALHATMAVADAKIHNAKTTLAQAISTDDDATAQFAVKRMMEGSLGKLAAQGLANDPEAVNAAMQQVRGEYVKIRVEDIAQKNPYAALQYLDKNQDAFNGDERNQLYRTYRAQAAAVKGQVDAGIIAGPGGVDDTGNGEGHVVSKTERIAFAKEYAESKGLNPDAILATMQGEGLNKYHGDFEGGKPTSFGDLQLHAGGRASGMGDMALAAGINVRDPNTWKEQIKFGIDQMAEHRGDAEWYAGQWHGAPAWAAQSFSNGNASISGQVSKQGGGLLGVGDSIAAHLIRKAGVGGKEYNAVSKADSTAVSGWGPSSIANMIDHFPEGKVKGQDVVLSTGASNAGGTGVLAPADADAIKHQIDSLKAKGAKSITVLGVGNRADFEGRNDQLQKIAADSGAVWAGAIDPTNLQPDGVHAKNPTALLAQVRAAQNAAGPKAPDTIQSPTQTPQGVIPAALPKIDFPLPPLDPGELPDAQVPGMAASLKHIMDTVPANDVISRINAVKAARQYYNAQYQDFQRARKLDQDKVNAADTEREDQILRRMAPGSPNPPTAAEILQDPVLKPTTKTKLVSFGEREGKADPAQEVSKGNTVALYRDIADGKITDEKPIADAYIKQQLTRADHDWLVKQSRDLRAAGGDTLQKTKNDWFKATQHKIQGLIPQYDSEAGIRMFGYQQFVDQKIDEYKKAGKNPFDLFNPKNPDYIGSDDAMKPFLQSDKQSASAAQKAAAGAAPDLSKMTIPELNTWVRTQQTEAAFDAGEKELIRRGIIQPRGPQLRAPVAK